MKRLFRSAVSLALLIVPLAVGCDSGGRSRSSRSEYSGDVAGTGDSGPTPTADGVADSPGPLMAESVEGSLVPLDVPTIRAVYDMMSLAAGRGATEEEVLKGRVTLESGETVLFEAVLAAVATRAEEGEEKFRLLEKVTTPGDRGIGDVLLVGKLPRKVLARHRGIFIRDPAGFESRPMLPAVPYFVFEETGHRLLIGRYQEKDVAMGWVNHDDVYQWSTRRLAYPKRGSRPLRIIGREDELPPFNPTTMMAWPILHDDGTTMQVLADLRPVGGGIMPVPIHSEDVGVYVILTDYEIDEIVKSLLTVQAAIASRRFEVSTIVSAVGQVWTQNQVDFLDFSEFRALVDLFPGKIIAEPGDFLMRRRLDERFADISRTSDRYVEFLTSVQNSSGLFNDGNKTYTVPLEAINHTRGTL